MAAKAIAKVKTKLTQPRSRVLDKYDFKDPAMKAWVAELIDSFTEEEAKSLAKIERSLLRCR